MINEQETLKTVTRLKDWSELIPSELAAAQTLQLDESSWPRFNDDDGEPEHVVRHSARTTIFWRDLTEAEREAAHQVGAFGRPSIALRTIRSTNGTWMNAKATRGAGAM